MTSHFFRVELHSSCLRGSGRRWIDPADPEEAAALAAGYAALRRAVHGPLAWDLDRLAAAVAAVSAAWAAGFPGAASLPERKASWTLPPALPPVAVPWEVDSDGGAAADGCASRCRGGVKGESPGAIHDSDAREDCRGQPGWVGSDTESSDGGGGSGGCWREAPADGSPEYSADPGSGWGGWAGPPWGSALGWADAELASDGV